MVFTQCHRPARLTACCVTHPSAPDGVEPEVRGGGAIFLMIWSVEVLLCIHNGIPSVPPASAPCSASRAPQTLGAMPRKNRGGKAKAGAEVEATATYIAGVMQQPENVMAAPAVGKISVEMPSAVVGVEGAFELAEGTASVSAKEVSPATEQKEREAALAGKREADTALMKLKAAEAEVCVCKSI